MQVQSAIGNRTRTSAVLHAKWPCLLVHIIDSEDSTLLACVIVGSTVLTKMDLPCPVGWQIMLKMHVSLFIIIIIT